MLWSAEISTRASTLQPPHDEQIIVRIDDQGNAVVLAIFDEIREPSAATQRDTYKGFVARFGKPVAETAVPLFLSEQKEFVDSNKSNRWGQAISAGGADSGALSLASNYPTSIS